MIESAAYTETLAACAIGAWALASLALLGVIWLRWRDRRAFKVGIAKLDETAAELAQLEARYGRYRILDRLAGGDVAKAIVDMGDKPAHWLAIGGACLAAESDERLGRLIEAKTAWLNGEFDGNYGDWIAEQITTLCFDAKSGANRALTPRERIVTAAVSTDGKAALALVIKHLAEVYPNEEPTEQSADARGPIGVAA